MERKTVSGGVAAESVEGAAVSVNAILASLLTQTTTNSVGADGKSRFGCAVETVLEGYVGN